MKLFSAAGARAERRDFLWSLAALGLVSVCVLGGLAHDENWRKLLRVLIAASTYLSLLLLLWKKRGERLPPLWAFALAAGVAELSSGWLRPGAPPALTLWVAPAAALLLGGVHWLGLSAWRGVRRRLVRGRAVSGEQWGSGQ